MSSETILTIKVVPRARKTTLAGTRGDVLLIRLAAPPVDGAANAALIDFLARLLDIPRRDVAIIAGDTSRLKRVKISGLSAAEVGSRLAQTSDDR